MGVRQIIGHIVAYAVDVTRKVFNIERVFVHAEFEIPVVNSSKTGNVHGGIDLYCYWVCLYGLVF